MTKSEQAYRLRYEQGLTIAEVAEDLGVSYVNAKNAIAYWRNRAARLERERKRYAEDAEYRALKLERCRESAARRADAIKAYRRRPDVRERTAARKRGPKAREQENQRRRERYAEDEAFREERKAASRRYRAENLERVRAAARERARDPEAWAKRQAWLAANADALADRQRERLQDPEHRARRNADSKRWKAANRERLAAYRALPRQRAAAKLRNSIYRHGPALGPVHRALCDFKAAIHEKEMDHEDD